MNTFQAAPVNPYISSVLTVLSSQICVQRAVARPLELPIGSPMLNALARTKCFSSLQNHRKLTHSNEEKFAWSRESSPHSTRDIE
jgi:hypothetical protein